MHSPASTRHEARGRPVGGTGDGGGGGGKEREGRSHIARFINFTETRELFKLQRADQPRLSLISLIFRLPLPGAPTSFPVLSARVICSTTRCGGNNYCASKGATWPLIQFVRLALEKETATRADEGIHVCTRDKWANRLARRLGKVEDIY